MGWRQPRKHSGLQRVLKPTIINLHHPTTESGPKSARRVALGRLVERRERWSLSLRGWIALLLCGAVLIGVLVWGAHPFLAVTDQTETEFLVVEGWVPNYALEESIAKFRAKPYRLMFTVGGDILNGVNVEEGDNQASYAAKRLAWLGMDPKLVQSVKSPAKYRDRTYASATALRTWVEHQNLAMTSFNLVTIGTHARRSRLLFQEAFAGKARVGIIAVEDREYDPKRWWQYSEGVREVISEGAAYLYAKLFFHPAASGAEKAAMTPDTHVNLP